MRRVLILWELDDTVKHLQPFLKHQFRLLFHLHQEELPILLLEFWPQRMNKGFRTANIVDNKPGGWWGCGGC
jgi:hypothetical protein